MTSEKRFWNKESRRRQDYDRRGFGFALAGALGLFSTAGFAAGAGLVWANKPFPAAASSIPITSMIARRMARSFLLTVFSQAALLLLPRLLPPEPYQPAS